MKNIENHLVAFTRIDEIPTLPEAARVAITKTLSFEKSADEIAAIVKKTPSLTLKLLKLANSSYYSRGRKVATTRDAIMRLGYRTVKSLILSLSIKDIFQEARSDLFEYRRFWLHSIATGVIAEEIQKTLKVKLENDAYSAGLLHDVGKVFFSIADPDRYAEVVRMVRTKRMSFVDAERETYGFDHTDTAYFLFEQWDLPPFLGTAVRMHHAGPEETGFSAHGAIVALSNQLSHMSGYNIDPAEPPYQADPRLIKELGLKKDDLDTVMRELKDHLEPFAEALNIPHSDIKGYFETLSSANRELGSMFLTTQQAGESLDRKEHLCVALNRLSLLFLSTEGSAEPLKEAVRLMIETFALESAALEVYMERETSNLIGGFRPPDGKGIEVQEKTVERGRTPRFEDMTAVPVSSDGREVGRVYYAKREELSEKDLVVFVDQLAVGFRNLQLHQEKKTGNAKLRIALRHLQRECSRSERLRKLNDLIFEISPIGLLILDESGRVIHCNRASEDLLQEKLDGKTFQEVSTAEGWPERDTPIFGAGAEEQSWEVSIQRNHTRTYLHVLSVPIEGTDQTLVLVSEITDRFEREKIVIQKEKMATLGELAAGIAHNLRSPLAVIKGVPELILSDIEKNRLKVTRIVDAKETEDTDLRDNMELINRSMDKTFAIIDSIMEFSRQESGEFEEVSLHRIIEEVHILTEHKFHGKRITFVNDTEPCSLHGNRNMIIQIFLNLINNAIDAVGDGGTIEVRCRHEEKGMIIHVIDDGRGIAEENLEKVFEPFFTTSGKANGTGIGLSITRRMITLHGGSIKARRGREGRTIIEILFPDNQGKRK